MDQDKSETDAAFTLDRETKRILKRILEEEEEKCNQRSVAATKVPSWFWNILITLAIVTAGAISVTSKVMGSFEEFKASITTWQASVNARLGTIEQRQYDGRTRSPENYASPPVVGERPR